MVVSFIICFVLFSTVVIFQHAPFISLSLSLIVSFEFFPVTTNTTNHQRKINKIMKKTEMQNLVKIMRSKYKGTKVNRIFVFDVATNNNDNNINKK